MHIQYTGAGVMYMQDRTGGPAVTAWMVGLRDRVGDTNRTGMNVSMLPSESVPVRQCGVLSLGLLSVA